MIAGTNWIGLWTLIIREVGRFFSVYRQTVLPGLISSGLYILVFGFTLERGIEELMVSPILSLFCQDYDDEYLMNATSKPHHPCCK
ncbi:MAG: hypothetical protein CM1200mP10_20520 [Candidatus Neomarinimicrobiota bacterium]|nr:MAG: hypothetical protein CM1200mP10_20520 [Candidatus Neomarinimicrobiota bacterium]